MLDEATSALDAGTRKVVLENVSRHMRHGVLIMITHDPHLMDWADEVLDFAMISGSAGIVEVPAISS